MNTNKHANSTPVGFDSPVVSREDDHLNRWPLAREVFGIATTGPANWSVRIGIYGEWGSGKSTVLEFVEQMAKEGRHVLIRFNPWQYSSREDLWEAFVLAVYTKPELRNFERAGWVHTKKRLRGIFRFGKPLEEGASFINENTGKALGTGIDLLNGMFSLSKNDLKSLSTILGSKRIIVLIDDLDRTAAELVPEILYALKELMNIPGFSFICAFDPVVVGQVLGEFHPGFGDGLKFLDKIIDYPRWMSPPTKENLTKLALSEAKRSCDFVPESAIRDAISSLPPNPRSVRQFIRLLALLKPQIQRHHDYELQWSPIIVATVLKIQYPHIAYELLNAPSLWEQIGTIGLAFEGEQEKEETRKAVVEHINKVCSKLNITLKKADQDNVETAVSELASNVNVFTGLRGESISYQFNIAEAPTAVTWKEFDQFLERWLTTPFAKTVTTWIEEHKNFSGRTEREIYQELTPATVKRYSKVLNKAEYAFTESEKLSLKNEAKSLLALLNTLVFENGKLSFRTQWIGDNQLTTIIEKFSVFADTTMPVHVEFWPKNEEFILKLFDQWSGDILLLIKLIEPHLGIYRRNFGGAGSGKLHKKLCDLVLPKFAVQIIEEFRQAGFVARLIAKADDTWDTRCVIKDPNGPIWKRLNAEVGTMLKEAQSNPVVQENSYKLLHWLIVAREGSTSDYNELKALFSDQAIFDAVWKAATATQLGPRAVAHIRELPDVMKELNVSCTLPAWWLPTTPTSTAPSSPQQSH